MQKYFKLFLKTKIYLYIYNSNEKKNRINYYEIGIKYILQIILCTISASVFCKFLLITQLYIKLSTSCKKTY